MKLTNNEIFFLYEGLNEVFTSIKETLPAKIGFNIIKNLKIVEPIYSSVIETRDTIVKNNATDTSDGKAMVDEAKMNYVNEQLIELGNIENEVELHMIKLDLIGDYDIPLSTLNKIYAIIEE